MEHDVKKELAKGVYYTAVAKYAGIFISIGVVAVLARLIPPEEFGIVAIATVIIQFLSTFGNFGIGPAIIQHKELSDRDIYHIFSFTVWLALGLSMLFFFGSWPIASYYQNEQLRIISQLLTINLFFAIINTVPNYLLYRDKEFKFISYRTLFVQLIGAAASIFAAFNGLGIYSLIINPIFSVVVLFIINFIKYPQKFMIKIDPAPIKLIFSFSSYLFIFDMINYLTRNLDKLIVGRYLDMKALGFYEKSYRLMMLPLQNINHVIGPVMHPVFSDLRNDLIKLSYSYEKIVRLMAFIGFPLSVLLFFTSEELVLLFFGGNWLLSVPSFKILSFSVGIQIVLSTSGSIFQSSGSTRYLMISGIFSSIATISALLIAVVFFGTIEAVAWSVTISFVINFIQAFYLMYRKVFKKRMLFFYQQLWPSMILTAIIVLANIVFSWFNLFEGAFVLSLSAKSMLSLVIFVGYIQISGEYNILTKVKELFNKL
ncbi:MAG: lipopolysaccharide biosynthesis protein [Eubacteriales bacterium]|jgi:PST family polysaccharide transporter|nr:lipopolysaccharide biosynthesis protein [Eubacteriales bacterium]MDX9798160.1 lipopolysaccharide biosynthesis protein [Bacteroidales bacterium]